MVAKPRGGRTVGQSETTAPLLTLEEITMTDYKATDGFGEIEGVNVVHLEGAG